MAAYLPIAFFAFAAVGLVAGAIVAASHGPWPVWVAFIGAGIILALRGRE